jgi:hypothetical protein
MLVPMPQEQPDGRPNPPDLIRTCESCGKTDSGTYFMNVVIVVGVAGHPEIKPFQCTEHWACSPSCWLHVAYSCIGEHMHPAMVSKQKEKGITN